MITGTKPLTLLAATSISFSAASDLQAAGGEAPRPAPNIVFILADDLGIGDLRCYNPDSKVPTPALDRLAREGMVWSNAYCPDAVCTPSRYALLTGRYCWRTPHQKGVLKNWAPPLIEEGRPTLPGMLREGGYQTAGFGKWHLGADFPTLDGKPPVGMDKFESPGMGANLDLQAPVAGGPIARGFDRWWGFLTASEGLILDQDRPVAYLGDKAVPEARGIEKLELLKVADFLPEVTRQAVDYVSEQAPSARNGRPFFLYFSPYVPHIPLAVSKKFRGKTKAGDYGDYVHELDHYVGVLLDALDRNGLSENTLVFFASDNGSQWTDTGPAHHRPNAPCSGGKWTIHEGGVRAPLIARWPGRIPPGSSNGQLVALNDIFATCAALTGQSVPANAAEDSVNVLPALLGEDADRPIRESLVVKATGSLMAVRQGKWKFVDGKGAGHGNAGPDDKHPGQLYDLEADPGEAKNLYAEYPEVVAELKTRLDAIRAEGAR